MLVIYCYRPPCQQLTPREKDPNGVFQDSLPPSVSIGPYFEGNRDPRFPGFYGGVSHSRHSSYSQFRFFRLFSPRTASTHHPQLIGIQPCFNSPNRCRLDRPIACGPQLADAPHLTAFDDAQGGPLRLHHAVYIKVPIPYPIPISPHAIMLFNPFTPQVIIRNQRCKPCSCRSVSFSPIFIVVLHSAQSTCHVQ